MPRTISTTASVDIAAPPAQVWDLTSDLTRYAEWVHGTVEVTGGDAVAFPGAVYTERNRVGPMVVPSSWRVEEVDRTRGFQRHVSSPSPGIKGFTVQFWVEPISTGTRYRIELRAEVAAGPMTPVLASMLRRSLTASNGRTVAAFAALAESEASVEPGVR